MDNKVFIFTRSRLSRVCLIGIYCSAFFVVMAKVPGSWQGALSILIFFLFFVLDIYRCGLLGTTRPEGVKLYDQCWQLLLNDQWQRVDCAVYYRCFFFLMLQWRDSSSMRSHYCVIWRDALTPAQWALLRMYLVLLPATKGSCD